MNRIDAWACFSRLAMFLGVAALVGLACGCQTKTSERDLSFLTPEDGVRLAAGGGGLRLGSPRNVVWVDPRTASEFEAGHVPGAINLPYQDLADREDELDAYDIVIVYGSDYNDPKAHGMSKRLLETGRDARTLRGGLRAWRDSGRDVEGG